MDNFSFRKSCKTDYGDTETMTEARGVPAVLKSLSNHAALARVGKTYLYFCCGLLYLVTSF